MVLDNILRAYSQDLEKPEQSVGEIFYNALKNSSNTKPIVIDALTEETFTAKQVFQKSVQVALKLTELGVKQGDMVGIIAENRVDYIYPVLACFYLGAPMNLLNPDYVSREILQAFRITKPKFIIASSGKLEDCLEAMEHEDFVENILTFEEISKPLDDNDFDESKLHIATGRDLDVSEHLAIVLCSSGTTGFPKGVAITHNNIKYSLIFIRDPNGIGINTQEVFLAMLPFYHVFGFMTYVCGFLYEATAIVLSKFKPDIYLKAIEKYQITKLFLVPPLALFLAKSPLTSNYNLSCVQDMICGAAPLGAEAQLALESKFGVPLRQAYGLTETCALSLTPPNDTRYPGSSGKLLVNTTLKIIDLDTGRALAANQTGEICAKTPTTMKCYFGNWKATEEMLEEDGFVHTGDIGYYNDDGFIYIVDRLKELIKYKGFQVPPAELEDILISHEEISDAAVIGIKDERAGELARAYVVKRENSRLSEQDIIQYVAGHVSIQKQLHGGVEFLKEIPKSRAGKILRRELRKLANQ